MSGDNGPAEAVFESAVLELDRAVDRSRVETALRDWPQSILRVKGVMQFSGRNNGLHVVQRVGRRWSIEQAPNDLDRDNIGKLVVLGLRGTLHRQDLAASLLH